MDVLVGLLNGYIRLNMLIWNLQVNSLIEETPHMEFVKCFTHLRFPKFSILREIFWQKIENVGCFTHLFWTNWLSLCKFLLKYKATPVILWKIKPDFGKFYRKSNSSCWFLKFYPSPKIYYTSAICAVSDKFHVWERH